MTKIIIQCSSSKNGTPLRMNGQEVKFVAHPEFYDSTSTLLYAHPDDTILGRNISWRELVGQQEAVSTCLKALDLYKPPIYGEIAKAVGYENTFILSAGWGLVRGDFRLPDYDITFSNQGVEKGKRRRKNDRFSDFNQLPDSNDDCVIFAGLSYLPLINKLTASYPANESVITKAISLSVIPTLSIAISTRKREPIGTMVRPNHS